MKKLLFVLAFAGALALAETTHAQCLGGRCVVGAARGIAARVCRPCPRASRVIYQRSTAVYGGYYAAEYAPAYGCETATVDACAPVAPEEVAQPCAPVETVEPAPQPCAPATLSTEPVTRIETTRRVIRSTCPGGRCPLW